MSIRAGLPLSFKNESGVPIGTLANVPALATIRPSSPGTVIAPSRT
jgi:hypothetical protein